MTANTQTSYILEYNAPELKGKRVYLMSFTQHGWVYAATPHPEHAMTFPSMTLALCVGFCLGFGPDMQAIPFGRQLDLWP